MCLYIFSLLYRKITSTIVWECEKLCLRRCLIAASLAIVSQFLWLAVFLLAINFHLFHLFSIDTWLSLGPLISAVILYCDFLGICHLSGKHYYGTRFYWLIGATLQKCSFLVSHTTVGFLTARLYVRHLHVDFNDERSGTNYINAKYLFLVGGGIFAGFCQWIDESLKPDDKLKTPISPVSLHILIEYQISLTLRNSLKSSFRRTLFYGCLFWLVGDMINQHMARHYNLEADTTLSTLRSLATNTRLLFFSWILSWQIVSTMVLMRKLFIVLLYVQIPFPIVKRHKVTLEEALGMCELPIVQYLAAYELYFISLYPESRRFQLIFALTMPNRDLINLNQLAAGCISVINAFREKLTKSIKNIPSTMKSPPRYQNQALSYMFDEPNGAKTAFLLADSHTIIWMSLGLAGICAASKAQNKFDVIQTAEPRIKRALLELNAELVKLSQVDLNSQMVDRHLKRLQNTVKLSLNRIDDPMEMLTDESFIYD